MHLFSWVLKPSLSSPVIFWEKQQVSVVREVLFAFLYLKPGFGDFDTFSNQIFREGRTLLGVPFRPAALSYPQGEKHSPAKNTCGIEVSQGWVILVHTFTQVWDLLPSQGKGTRVGWPGMPTCTVVTLAFCWLKIHFIQFTSPRFFFVLNSQSACWVPVKCDSSPGLSIKLNINGANSRSCVGWDLGYLTEHCLWQRKGHDKTVLMNTAEGKWCHGGGVVMENHGVDSLLCTEKYKGIYVINWLWLFIYQKKVFVLL